MSSQILSTAARGRESRARVLLMHGAGAPMDSEWMLCVTETMAERGLTVYRAEFDYMAQRRVDGKKRPPPRADKLLGELSVLIEQLPSATGPLILAGKSMGGRLASMLAADPKAPEVAAVWALGYPFHPPGKPERMRTAHFAELRCPLHILQGTRDPMGDHDQVSHLMADPDWPHDRVTLNWIEDGNHDLRPRGLKKAEVMPRLARDIDMAVNRWLRLET